VRIKVKERGRKRERRGVGYVSHSHGKDCCWLQNRVPSGVFCRTNGYHSKEQIIYKMINFFCRKNASICAVCRTNCLSNNEFVFKNLSSQQMWTLYAEQTAVTK
jgi:hypothetical protein